MVRASIIIRTKNEAKWIGDCLEMVSNQTEQDFEVVLVDNESTDETVAIAQRHGIDTLVTVTDYKPGYALNLGFEAAEGTYGVCLSGHCIPKTDEWLETLLENFADQQVAGVYGRQIPMSFSSDYDKRDLMTTFGVERRVQTKDYFFHNANSALRMACWEDYPFDEETTNIEDRIWAKEMIGAGYHLVYEPAATVYHHHGIHQNMSETRARNVVSVLEEVEAEDDINDLPAPMRPTNTHLTAVCPVWRELPDDTVLDSLLSGLAESSFVDSSYVLADPSLVPETREDVALIDRPTSLDSPDKTVEDVLQYALEEMEDRGEFPDALVYANCLFPSRPDDFFDRLVRHYQYEGRDTVFGGYEDYNNYWVKSDDEEFEVVGDGLKPRSEKQPLYRALYGLGTVADTSVIRQGTLVGEHVGIIPLADEQYTRKLKHTATDQEPGRGAHEPR